MYLRNVARVLVSNTLIKVHVNQVNIRFCEIYLNARPDLANLTIALRSTVLPARKVVHVVPRY